MKQSYERASMSVVTLAPIDIITTSGPVIGDKKDPIFLPEDIF